jgi:hypothetical protein
MSDMIVTAVGWSAKAEAAEAGTQAAEMALERLSPQRPALAIVLGSSRFDQVPLLHGVRSTLGEVPLAGESTAGEIVSEGPLTYSVVVWLIASDALLCSLGVGEAADRAPREAGQHAAHAAIQGFQGPRKGLLLFGDGLLTRYADILRGLQEILGTSALIVGGMAGDDLRFAQTYQYANERVLSHAVVGILLGGPIALGIGCDHGFAPISKPRRITRARANILYELDRQPATSVYEEYLGADVIERMRHTGFTRQHLAYPLGIQCEPADPRLLRNVVSFGEDGSLRCSGEIPEGGWLQLMIGSQTLALEAARRAAQEAIRPLNRVAGVLVFDSIARRKLLGPRHAAMEIAQIRQVIGLSTPLAGCYTYGEHGPAGSSAAAERATIQTGSVLIIAIGS